MINFKKIMIPVNDQLLNLLKSKKNIKLSTPDFLSKESIYDFNIFSPQILN